MAQRTTGMPMANHWSTFKLNPPCNNNHKKLLYCEGCKYTDIFHVKSVGAFSAKHTRGFTVQIEHRLIRSATEISCVRNTTSRKCAFCTAHTRGFTVQIDHGLMRNATEISCVRNNIFFFLL